MMKVTRTRKLLEEAIRSWELEIKELKHTAEWIREETHTRIKLDSSINFKKELIEDAKILMKEIA